MTDSSLLKSISLLPLGRCPQYIIRLTHHDPEVTLILFHSTESFLVSSVLILFSFLSLRWVRPWNWFIFGTEDSSDNLKRWTAFFRYLLDLTEFLRWNFPACQSWISDSLPLIALICVIKKALLLKTPSVFARGHGSSKRFSHTLPYASLSASFVLFIINQ